MLFEDVFNYLQNNVPIAYALVFFPFGACVGSFLNVVVCRLPHKVSLLEPPSTCPRCGRHICGIFNIPVLSWFILDGKCLICREPISFRYPAIEFLTGVIWSIIAFIASHGEFGHYMNVGILMVYLVFASMLISISIIDFDLQIIPDELSLGGLTLSLVAAVMVPTLHPEFRAYFPNVSPWLTSVLGALVGAGTGGLMLLVLTLAGTLLFRNEIRKAQADDPDISTAIGLGDVKLMAFVGSVMGWQETLASFALGTVLGALAGTVDKLRTGHWPEADSQEFKSGMITGLSHKWEKGNSVMPYGPFLCIGALLVLIFRPSILGIMSYLVPSCAPKAEFFNSLSDLF